MPCAVMSGLVLGLICVNAESANADVLGLKSCSWVLCAPAAIPYRQRSPSSRPFSPTAHTHRGPVAAVQAREWRRRAVALRRTLGRAGCREVRPQGRHLRQTHPDGSLCGRVEGQCNGRQVVCVPRDAGRHLDVVDDLYVALAAHQRRSQLRGSGHHHALRRPSVGGTSYWAMAAAA